MNKNKKRKALGRVPLDALPSSQRSNVLDPKGELAAVTANRAKKKDGVMTLNPFVVLPQPAFENYSKWFRLLVTEAMSEFVKEQRKEGHDRKRKRE